MTNFGLADLFLRFIESQNDFKKVITRFQKYVYFPQYSGVRTLQLRDKNFYSKNCRILNVFNTLFGYFGGKINIENTSENIKCGNL